MNNSEYDTFMHLTAGVGNATFLDCLLEKPGLREDVALAMSLLNCAIINGNLPVINLLLKNPLILERFRNNDVANELLETAIFHEEGGVAAVNCIIEAIGKDYYDASFFRNAMVRAAYSSRRPLGIMNRLSAFYQSFFKSEAYQNAIYINRLLDIDVVQKDVEWYKSNRAWPILAEFLQKRPRTIALEVSRSAYSDLTTNHSNAFPEKMDSEYATQFAMGILAQFKSSNSTPNPIMSKILSYLPVLTEATANDAQLLVAGRNALVAPKVEEVSPTLLIKRKANYENEAKRQKLSTAVDISAVEQEDEKDLKRKPESQGGNSKRLKQ